jgi:3-oxoacyl-[acyl-carrier-protein] synthase-3
MVHGRLGGGPMEVLSAAGVCASGAAALKAAHNTIITGQHDRAVAAASELPSVMMKAERFAAESVLAESRDGVATAYQYFNADFLRWMLSDGAGAVVIENAPNPDGLSLRIDWIELTSYAHEHPTCMFLGSSDPRDLAVGKTWLSVDNATRAEHEGMMVIRQDTDLLAQTLLGVGVEECRRLIKTGRIDPELGYDWFLPHISSYYFYNQLVDAVAESGLDIPEDRWFTNLRTRGNTGSASLYLMLEEAMNGGRFREGDRILAFVPESGRFIVSFLQFTVVAP